LFDGVGYWGYCFITIFQQIASLGNNVAIQIAAGNSLKVTLFINYCTSSCIHNEKQVYSMIFWFPQAVYKHYYKDGTLTLQEFIIFFGAFELLLSQLPDIHSLRWVNSLCTFSTIGFAGTTIGVTIYNGII